MSTEDTEHLLFSPREEETALTLSEELRNRYLTGVLEHESKCVSVQGASCSRGAHENAWPQLPNTLFPTLCPYFLAGFDPLNGFRLKIFATVFAVVVVVSSFVIVMKTVYLLWKSVHDCTNLLCHTCIAVTLFLEESSIGARKKSWAGEGWVISQGHSDLSEVVNDFDLIICDHWNQDAKIAERGSPSP